MTCHLIGGQSVRTLRTDCPERRRRTLAVYRCPFVRPVRCYPEMSLLTAWPDKGAREIAYLTLSSPDVAEAGRVERPFTASKAVVLPLNDAPKTKSLMSTILVLPESGARRTSSEVPKLTETEAR